MANRAVVLFSGGLDSTTCLALARSEGLEIVALSFDYGQRHRVELEAVRHLLDHYEVESRLQVRLDVFSQVGGSALTADIDVPRHDSVDELSAGVPITYVPARNLVFLAQATAVAEALEAPEIFIGANAVDFSGYPDCRPEFLEAFEVAANRATCVGTEGGALRVRAPLVDLTKAEIILRGHGLNVPYELTHSCYAPVGEEGLACRRCDSCLLRSKGFADAGLPDPTRYADAQGEGA